MEFDLLQGLKTAYSTLCQNNFEKIKQQHIEAEMFEYISGLILQEESKGSLKVFIWSKLPKQIKEDLGFPAIDVGIDYVGIENGVPVVFGQSKNYSSQSRITAKSINRSMLCYYHANDNYQEKYNKKCIQFVEFATRENVKFNNTRINFDTKIKKRIITNEQIKYWIDRAVGSQRLTEDYSNIPTIDFSKIKININFDNVAILFNQIVNISPQIHVNIVNDTKPNKYQLRKCQSNALNTIKNEGITRLKLPCGSGKSLIVIDYILSHPGTYLILVPYLILQQQWTDLLITYQIDHVLIGTGNHYSEDIIFENKTTICVYNSIETLEDVEFDRIFVDEAHHLKLDDVEENSYLSVIKNRTKETPTVLLSATLLKPDYEYTIREAINDSIIMDYDIRVPFFLINNGKTDENVDMISIAKYMAKNLKYLSVLAYCKTINNAKQFTEICNKLDISAVYITCEESSQERKKILREFQEGKYRILVSVNVLGEGIDIPCADTCLFVEPRSSYNFIIQCVGRVLRKYPGKCLAHIIVPELYYEGFDIRKNSIVEILSSLSREDPTLLKLNKGRSASLLLDKVIIDKNGDMTNNIEDKNTGVEAFDTFMFEDVYDSMIRAVTWGDWDYKYTLFSEFYKLKGRLPMYEEIFEGVLIGSWLGAQKTAMRKSKLSIDRFNKLNAIDIKWTIDHRKSWDDMYLLLQEFYTLNSRLPVADEFFNNANIGRWLNLLKLKFKNGTLDIEKINELNLITSKWNTNLFDERWDTTYLVLSEFYTLNSRLPKTGEIFKDINIGNWINRQKQQMRKGNLIIDRIDKLNGVTIDWNKEVIDKWDNNYLLLCEFYQLNKRLPKAIEKFKNVRIGRWIIRQRKDAREGKLKNDRIDKLNKILLNWY